VTLLVRKAKLWKLILIYLCLLSRILGVGVGRQSLDALYTQSRKQEGWDDISGFYGGGEDALFAESSFLLYVHSKTRIK